jgi:hypothetical protein
MEVMRLFFCHLQTPIGLKTDDIGSRRASIEHA